MLIKIASILCMDLTCFKGNSILRLQFKQIVNLLFYHFVVHYKPNSFAIDTVRAQYHSNMTPLIKVQAITMILLLKYLRQSLRA